MEGVKELILELSYLPNDGSINGEEVVDACQLQNELQKLVEDK